MTTIDKLQISGIRSFDPASLEVIKFFKPLTIIVGRNGSGKTTIIEALKFVCTGSAPPDSQKGKAFVHDNKRAGDAIVKAQIKVGFKTKTNKPVIAVRSLQVTQRKTSRQMKQIDGLIRMINNDGETVTMSKKCADMETMVPNLMGVTKAVISNVIFCHQEESCWPLGDAKSLKTKFDEIFSSSRYSKALENIKKLRNNQGGTIRDLENELKVLSHAQEVAHKYEDELEGVKRDMEKFEDRRKEMRGEISAYERKVEELENTKKEIDVIKHEIQQLEFRKQTVTQDRKQIYDAIVNLFDEPQEKLLAHRKQFAQRVEGWKNKSEHAQSKLHEIAAQRNALAQEIDESNKQFGKIQAEEEANRQNTRDASRMMTELASGYKINGFDTGNASYELLQEFVPRLNAIRDKNEQKCATLKDEYDYKDRQLDSQLLNYRQELTTLQSNIRNKKELRNNNHKRLKDFEHDLHNINKQLRSLEDIQHEIKKAEIALQKFEASPEHGRITSQIELKQEEHQRNSNRMESLEHEIKALRTQADAVSNLKFKRDIVQKKKETFEKAYEDCKRDVERALEGGNVPVPSPDKFREVMNQRVSGLENDKRKIASQLQTSKERVGLAEGKIQSILKEVHRLESDFRNRNAQLRDAQVASLKALHEMIKTSEDTVAKTQREKTFQEGAVTVYKRFLEKAQNQHMCPMCERNLKKQELEHFVKLNSSRSEKFTANQRSKKFDSKISEEKRRIGDYRKLLPIANDVMRLKSELAAKKATLEELNTEKSKEAKEHARLRELDQKIRSSESTIRRTREEAHKVTRLFEEHRTAATDLEREEYRLKAMAGGRRTYEEARNESETLQRKNRGLEKSLQCLRTRKEELINEKQRYQDNLNTVRSRGMKLRELESEKKRVENDYRSLNKLQAELIETLKNMQDNEPMMRRNVADKAEEREDLKKSYEMNARTLDEQRRQAQIDVQKFTELVRTIRQYQSLEAARASVLQTIERCNRQVRDLDEKKKDYEQESSTYIAKVQSASETLADLDNNIRFKQKGDEVLKYNKAINDKMDKIAEYADVEEIDAKLVDEQKVLLKLREENSKASGGLETLKNQAVSLLQSLRSESYKDIDKRVKHKLIDAETLKMAHQDLDKYQKALDKALIQYHAMKMDEINQTLKLLWQQVYRGQDIDEIAIVSTDDMDRLGASGTRRNYSYSVVMKQGDVELEMRGRCSAGQRVLASLLIRLALAEVFCVNCGVLALDEPTTNLDEHNVVAFAEALNAIINRRREQQSFQLIIITHDEQFVDMLGKRDHCDSYYRVYKDVNQHSRIQRQQVHEHGRREPND